MRNVFVSTSEAADLITTGQRLIVAGSPRALQALPHGNWIGGTTPYFMTPQGGLMDHDRVFCTVVDEAGDARIAIIAPDALPQITAGRFAQGFSYILVPAFSAVHQRFAIEAPDLPGLYQQPLVGWVTGVALAEIGTVSPLVIDGRTGEAHDNAVAVMHFSLTAETFGEADIINLFNPGDGDDIAFESTGFSATTCLINGKSIDFAAYLRAHNADTTLPLVSNYAGAMINVSFQAVHEAKVDFYAPVVAGQVYRLAAPVGDYPQAYGAHCTQQAGSAMLSFNCILNYLYAALEGKQTGGFVGPVTFGEIAYILLNQTLVRLDLCAQKMSEAAE